MHRLLLQLMRLPENSNKEYYNVNRVRVECNLLPEDGIGLAGVMYASFSLAVGPV